MILAKHSLGFKATLAYISTIARGLFIELSFLSFSMNSENYPLNLMRVMPP
jgi:hypothetical protein